MNKIKITMAIMIFNWPLIMKSDDLSDSSFFLLEILLRLTKLVDKTNKSLNDLFCYINIMQL